MTNRADTYIGDSMNCIELKNISKLYGKKRGVSDISFSVKKGSIFGLIGPNGAGKSTIIKLISGILKPDSGEINVLNRNPSCDIKELSQHYGLMFGNRSSLWFNLKAKESLLLMKDIYGIDNKKYNISLEKYASILNAEKLLEKQVRLMSLGERIKIEILTSLIHEPDLLIYDEPTIGLDIVSKLSFRQILNDIKAEGKTILITTHDLFDVEKICDDIILINDGKILLDMDYDKLKNRQNEYSILNIVVPIDRLKEYFIEENHGVYKYILTKDLALELNLEFAKIYSPESYQFIKPNLEELLYEYYH